MQRKAPPRSIRTVGANFQPMTQIVPTIKRFRLVNALALNYKGELREQWDFTAIPFSCP